MIAFTATLDEWRTRRVTLVAPNRLSAERALRRRMQGRNFKLLDLAEAGADHGPDAQTDVLCHLCSAPFLRLDGCEATVIDWLIALAQSAGDPIRHASLNAAIAHGGLRHNNTGIAIATSAVIPFLADVFTGTQWATGGWGRVLTHVSGASRRNMTFAGQRARAVILPHAAFPALKTRSKADDLIVFRHHAPISG